MVCLLTQVQQGSPSELATVLKSKIGALLLIGQHLHAVCAASAAAWPLKLPARQNHYVSDKKPMSTCSLKGCEAEHQLHISIG